MMMEKYQEHLYWMIRRLVWSHEDANDVLQNCFIKAYRNIDSFRGNARLYTWLYRIATNEALSHIRRHKRYRNGGSEAAEAAAAKLKADPWFDGDEARIQLEKAIATLPDKQRLVFNMRYFEELSYSELSEILETSEGALKASYHHAVRKIESFLKKIEFN